MGKKKAIRIFKKIRQSTDETCRSILFPRLQEIRCKKERGGCQGGGL